MNDLISRQAAIETVMECYDNDELFEVYEDNLRELPPAQPEKLTDIQSKCRLAPGAVKQQETEVTT